MSRRRALLLALLCLLLAAVGDRLAESYIDRLPNHAGYYLVSVPDQISPQLLSPPARPRHAVLVVMDGLRADHALKMQSVQRLGEAGQCHLTHVGSVSVSRPVYAVLSTGLEQDRTGSRNNDETTPLRAESIWQVARRAGLRVTGLSELPWFQQLFPDGFDSYKMVARPVDHFTTPESELGALALIHPIYVDENGHDHGGASPDYAAAAVRADQELGRLLDRLDLSRDVVVFTADHGHTDRGGHGAGGREVAQVLTCFSGHGILHQPQPSGRPLSELAQSELPRSQLFDNRTIGPAIAVLLQIPFPQNMRAGQDSLDSIWGIVDPSVYPAAYLADRRASVQRFREVNRAAVGRWLGRADGADWSELYRSAHRGQLGRGLLFLSGVALLCLLGRRYLGSPRPRFFVLWVLGTAALFVLIYTVARGSFDFNSINSRLQFIKWACIASLLSGTLALGCHYLICRDRVALATDQVRLALIVLVVNVAHIVSFGWPLGFPVPSRFLLFLPFCSGAFLAFESLLGFLVCLKLALLGPPQASER